MSWWAAGSIGIPLVASVIHAAILGLDVTSKLLLSASSASTRHLAAAQSRHAHSAQPQTSPQSHPAAHEHNRQTAPRSEHNASESAPEPHAGDGSLRDSQHIPASAAEHGVEQQADHLHMHTEHVQQRPSLPVSARQQTAVRPQQGQHLQVSSLQSQQPSSHMLQSPAQGRSFPAAQTSIDGRAVTQQRVCCTHC